MIIKSRQSKIENAVYGSFAFWERGYGLLARSAGCRPEWSSALERACRNLGEPPRGGLERGWFARPLDDGVWMIVGMHPQGADDHGRPGALAFHALFVSRLAYLLAGADPAPLAALTRGDWTSADRDAELPAVESAAPGLFGRLATRRGDEVVDPLVDPIVRALARGKPVVVQAPRPIDDLVRSVWRRLPWRARMKRSVATWAFDNQGAFDLIGLPRIKGATYDPDALVLERS